MTSWETVMIETRFNMFEDPITGTFIPKHEYNKIYGPACSELFSSEFMISIETFYTPNPLNTDCWMFVDNDAKLDLFDTAVEMGLLPELREIQAGETDTEKSTRENNPTDRIHIVNAMLQKDDISNKLRKKLTRELRGLKAKMN